MISAHEQEAFSKGEDRRCARPEELQDAHIGAVHAYVSRRVRSREDAEDVTSEVFAAAFSSFHKVRGDVRLWLFGLARRKIADMVRRRQRSMPVLDENIPSADDHHKDLEDRHDADILRWLVEQLPSDQREALMLQHLEELSIAQIAVVMKRSKTSVKGLLSRARDNLEKSGKGYFSESL